MRLRKQTSPVKSIELEPRYRMQQDQDSFPWLVADLGGTNARFGWVTNPSLRVQHVRSLPVAQYAGPLQAAQAYLSELPGLVASGAQSTPRYACLAVAGPLLGDEVKFANNPWCFSQNALREALGLQGLLLLNDFEALAWSVPSLDDAQLSFRGARPLPHSTVAVVGPGTGLGVAGMLPTPWGWQALAAEGGHASLAPSDLFEAELLRAAWREHPHLSAEDFLSGSGLERLYRTVAQVLGVATEQLNAEQISSHAIGSTHAVCTRTVDTFCALLGAFAGDVALTLGARGGVYIGGGIVPRWGDLFFSSRFRERFEAKGSYQALMKTIPTAVITDTLVALQGAAVALQREWVLPQSAVVTLDSPHC